MKGNSLPRSARGIGVAEWSTETTDRTGKTRSTTPGDRAVEGPSDLTDCVGDAGGSLLFPENMLTVVWRGDIPILVCIAAVRENDCDIEGPESERSECRELVEALRELGPSGCESIDEAVAQQIGIFE